MSKITVKFITLGCKTNLYESDAMLELFRARGYEAASPGEAADVCVINTCTVTGTGAQKSRQQIRRARKENPRAVIAVTGCFAQTEPEKVRGIEGVDILIGSAHRGRIVDMVEAALQGRSTDEIINIRAVHDYEELAIAQGQSRVRANVKIEDGCDNFCTYCIIPYARGPVRSRKLENIQKEVQALAGRGYREVVLTGIHIGSYGKDLDSGLQLIDVAEAIHSIQGIERIRLGSIEPVLITPDYVRRAAKLDKLCPQYHLSLQSGCDETLRRMNRHYTTAEYRDAVALLRGAIPDTAVTTDLMVGFAGETDEEFEQSYAFCQEIGFSQMHIFPYSIRKGTRAADLPGQISKQVKETRSHRMLELAENMKRKFYQTYSGRELPVLFEQRQADGRFHATTANYMDVLVDSAADLSGKLRTVRLGEYQGCYLLGELV